MDNVAKKFAAEQYIFDCDISALMKEFQNSSGPTKYKSIIQSYMSYRQCKQVIHSKQSLTNFMILEMSNLRMEPIRFNSTTFSGRVDLLDHIICYVDTSPDVLAYRQRMQTEAPNMWPKI